MKVAVFTETYHPQMNGVVVFLSDFLPVLSKKAEVLLFAPGGKKLKKEKAGRQFRIFWVPANPFPFYEGYRMSKLTTGQIEKILKEEKPDIVHLHAPVLMGLKALYVSKKLGIPVVATYHTHFPDYVPHFFKGMLPNQLAEFAKSPVKKMISYVFSTADCTTAPTLELKKELEAYGVKNALYVPNGILLKKFRKGDRGKFIRKYGIPPEKPVVLYVGRVSFEKRIEHLIRAFAKVENATLVIVGSGPYLDKYRKMAKAAGLENVIFTGFVTDSMLASAYASADVFASASDSETFGLTFVEAMSFGIPVVGIGRLGAKEVIHDGRNGFLVEVGKEEEIADKINLLLAKPALRKRLGMQGKKDAEKYGIGKIVSRCLGLYKKLSRR